MIYYKTGNRLAADLKATAHRVRQTIDALPSEMLDSDGRRYNPRKRRLCPMTDPVTGKMVAVAPHLPGHVRHEVSFRKGVRFG